MKKSVLIVNTANQTCIFMKANSVTMTRGGEKMKGLGKGITLFLLGLLLIYYSYTSSGKPFTELLTTDVENIGLTLQAIFLVGIVLFVGGPLFALARTLTSTKQEEEEILPIFGTSVARKKQYASTSTKGKYDTGTHAITEEHPHREFAKNILDENKFQKIKPFYVKVNGIKFKVKGDKKDYTHWQVACEHSDFKELCLDCALNVLEKFNWDNIEIQE